MQSFRHIGYLGLVLLGGMLLIGWSTSPVTAQTCTPPPSGNIQIQSGGATRSHGASGIPLQGRMDTAFSATIQTLGIDQPLDIILVGLPPGIEHRSTPLHPLGGNTFAGTPTQQGTFTIQITLENDCGSETYTVPFTIAAVTSVPAPTPPTPTPSGEPEPSGGAQTLAHKATLIDIPLLGQLRYGGGGGIGSQRILDAAYFGDNLAFSGECGGSKDHQYNQTGFGGTHGGAWFFKDNGTLVAERSACIDGGAQYLSLLFHGHAYSALAADGDQGVVMRIRSHGASCQNCSSQNPQGGSGAYKPVYYQVSGNSVSASSGSWDETEGYLNHRYFGDIATANNILVADNNTNPATTDLVQVPGFQVLSNTSRSTLPVTGFEGYVIGQPAQGTNCPTMNIYRPTNNGQLQFLHELETDAGLCVGSYGIDYSTSPKRIAFMTFERAFDPSRGREVNQATDRLFIYAPGANGLELVEERQMPRTSINFVYGFGSVGRKHKIGISGNYLALPFPGNPRFEVWNGSERVGEAELPLSRPYGPSTGESPGPINHLIITKNGDVMASTYLSAHLYELTTLTPSPTPPTGPTGPTTGLGIEPGFFEDFARQYIDLLKQFFNAN